ARKPADLARIHLAVVEIKGAEIRTAGSSATDAEHPATEAKQSATGRCAGCRPPYLCPDQCAGRRHDQSSAPADSSKHEFVESNPGLSIGARRRGFRTAIAG